jgi:hypothetical protein
MLILRNQAQVLSRSVPPAVPHAGPDAPFGGDVDPPWPSVERVHPLLDPDGILGGLLHEYELAA